MAKGLDNIDFVSEETFKQRLPKLYRLVVDEGLRSSVDLKTFDFISCQSIFDVVDVAYTNYSVDFDMSVRGSEKKGYRVLYTGVSESLHNEDEFEDE